MVYIRHFVIVYFVSIISLHATINPAHFPEQDANQEINRIYEELNTPSVKTTADRIIKVSAKFLGKPYQLKALGEGAQGFYDQDPLYRTDSFDCETYVDTVLALAFGDNQQSFQDYINRVRYRNGNVSYTDRNHFTSVDWNQNNQQQGFLSDITTTIKGSNQQSIVQFAKAVIDKPSWYQHATIDAIHLPGATLEEKERRLKMLQQEGINQKQILSVVPYIPLTSLFDSEGKANADIFKQIPQAAIVEIVRPNWDLTAVSGTHQNISHLGFAIWQGNTLLFRHASSSNNGVFDQPLITYLKETRQSPTIKGINIQIVNPRVHP